MESLLYHLTGSYEFNFFNRLFRICTLTLVLNFSAFCLVCAMD